jgi:hypothetical protein
VQLTTARRRGAALIVSAGLSLAACGTASASHVVRLTPAAPGTAGGVAGAGSASAVPSSGLAAPSSASTIGPTDGPLNASTLSELDAELGAVDNNLSQSASDLNVSPQGDS